MNRLATTVFAFALAIAASACNQWMYEIIQDAGVPGNDVPGQGTGGSGGGSATDGGADSPDCSNGPTLTIDLAPNPVSTTFVKKQQNAPLVGITLSASCGDVHVEQLPIVGQDINPAMDCASFGDPCGSSMFDQRVTALGLYRDDALVGMKKVPEQGCATFNQMGVDIAEGTSVTLVAKATLGSTVGNADVPDQLAVGLGETGDIMAWDKGLNYPNIIVGSALQAQLNTNPSIVHRIRDHGVLTFTSGVQTPEGIVIAGSSAWANYGSYFLTAQYEDMKTDRLAMRMGLLNGYVQHGGDVNQIAIAQNGVVKGSMIWNPNSNSMDVDLSSDPIVIPKDSKVQFDVWVKLNPVASFSTASSTSARSGDAPQVCLDSLRTTGEWSAEYAESMNIRTTGAVSGEHAFAKAMESCSLPHELRKGKPVVTKMTPSSLTITSGSPVELYKFQITPDALGGGIAWKQIFFNVVTTGDITLSRFELYKGATRLSTTAGSEEVIIRSGDVDVTGNAPVGQGPIQIRLVNEESITGSGTVYTLRAAPAFTGAATIVTSFIRTPSPMNWVRGDVEMTGPLYDYMGTLVIDGNDPSGQHAFGVGYFMWSDLSDIPHSAALGAYSGSGDWTNSALVSDLTQAQALTW